MRQLKITQSITNRRESHTLEKYFTEVSGVPMITPEEEVRLAKEIKKGNQDALDKLVRANLRFVVSVAKQYQNRSLPLNDLINEGNLGLIKAAKKFDETKGFKFISYAVWWIRQSILQSLNDNARTIRLPANVIQELHKAKKEAKNDEVKLSKKLENLPTTLNLSKPINEDGDTLLELIPNEEADSPDAQFYDMGALKRELIETMSVLDEREAVIIKEYFGLVGYPKTLAKIGEDFGLTKERVRQIKEKALRKLRNESEGLLDYMSR